MTNRAAADLLEARPQEPAQCEGDAAALFDTLARRERRLPSAGPSGAEVAVFAGFDVLDRPLLAKLAGLPGEVVAGRSTVSLAGAAKGASVVVVFENADVRAPIIVGLLDADPAQRSRVEQPPLTATAAVDGERLVLTAEREVVLRCGDASITLTRGGRILIEGNFILSRSSGYNKIKGAAIEIN